MLQLTETQRLLRDQAAGAAREVIAPHALDVDREGRFPRESIDALAAAGQLAVCASEADGGLGGGLAGNELNHYVPYLEITKAGCGSTSIVMGHHSHMVSIVSLLGTDRQRDEVLGRVSEGSLIASCGADARPAADGTPGFTFTRHGDTLRLNGRKAYATMAGEADYYLLWCFERPTQSGQPPRPEDAKIQFVIVPRNLPGISTAPVPLMLGMRGSATFGVQFDDVRVPASEALLGDPGAFNQSGKLDLFGASGSLNYAANYFGSAYRAFERAREIASMKKPRLGGDSVLEDPVTRLRLTDLYILLRASESYLWSAIEQLHAAHGGSEDEMRDAYVEAYAARAFIARSALEITEGVFQVTGTSSTLDGTGLDLHWRDVRTFTLHDPIDARVDAAGKQLFGLEGFRVSAV